MSHFSVSTRGGLVENVHQISLTVADKDKNILYSTPDGPSPATFFRSAAKPFQAYPLSQVLALNPLGDERLAIACASHPGQAVHVGWAQALLTEAGLTDAALRCGPNPLHHNCSGKHAGFLLTCVRKGWPIEDYLSLSHPLQRWIQDRFAHWTGRHDIQWAVDGCGAPVMHLSLPEMAHLYAQLGTSPECLPMSQAMAAHPTLIGAGVDAQVMAVTGGRVLAKVGADGVLCASHAGRGLALKVWDGNADVRNRTFAHVLVHLGWLTAADWADERLKPYQSLARVNAQGREVGQLDLSGLLAAIPAF